MSDVEPPHRRDDDASLPILAHRLTALEHRVDTGFNQLDHRLDTLSFVRSDVYGERNIALEQRLKTMAEEIADAAKPGRWALALFASTLLAAIIAVIIQVALVAGG